MTQVSFSFAMIVLLGAGLAQDPSPAPQQASTPAQSQAQPSTPGSDKNQNALPPTEQSKAALPTKVIPGSRLFVASMQGNLDGFISAEIVKKKLSVIVTTEENTADYVLTGTSIKADDKWYHTVFGGKDKNEGNVALIRVKDKTLVWAGEAGDRSMWWGAWSRGGQRKVADRIISKLKKDMF